MSPKEDWTSRERNQLQDNREEKRERGRQPRRRECLLKGCGKRYRPRHPMARYCSRECGRAARQWSQWRSRRRWRESENGREKRKQQTARHRERLRVGGRASTRPGPALLASFRDVASEKEAVERGPGDVARGPEDVARGSSQGGWGRNFFQRSVIVLGATRAITEQSVHRCSDSAVMTAVGR